MKIRSNKKQILQRFKQAFYKSAVEFDSSLKQTISTPQHWDGFEGRVTRRQNGEVVVGAYRNIVDTANLINSQRLNETPQGVDITWDGNGVTPVVGVFFGQRTESGWIPGRNWVDPTLQGINLPNLVKREFNG